MVLVWDVLKRVGFTPPSGSVHICFKLWLPEILCKASLGENVLLCIEKEARRGACLLVNATKLVGHVKGRSRLPFQRCGL